MKKLLTLALALMMAMSLLSACGSAPLPTADEIKGSVDGNVYTNAYTGLKFTASGDWYFMSEDEIEEITGTTQEILDQSGSDADVTASIYDMMAMDQVTANNVNVMIQIVGDSDDVDFDEVLDESEAEILEMGASIGANYSFSEHSTVTLSGIEFHKLTATADYSGVTFVQGCYIAVKDNVCLNVTLTSYDGTPLSDIEAMFN